MVYGIFCGWLSELRVVVDRNSHLTLYLARSSDRAFDLTETDIVELIARQLSVGLRPGRGASPETLAIQSTVLKRTVDSLVGEEDFEQLIGRMLAIASEQMHAPVVECPQTGSGDGVIVVFDREAATLRSVDYLEDAASVNSASLEFSERFAMDVWPGWPSDQKKGDF